MRIGILLIAIFMISCSKNNDSEKNKFDYNSYISKILKPNHKALISFTQRVINKNEYNELNQIYKNEIPENTALNIQKNLKNDTLEISLYCFMANCCYFGNIEQYPKKVKLLTGCFCNPVDSNALITSLEIYKLTYKLDRKLVQSTNSFEFEYNELKMKK